MNYFTTAAGKSGTGGDEDSVDTSLPQTTFEDGFNKSFDACGKKHGAGTPPNNECAELSFDSDDVDPLLNKSCAAGKKRARSDLNDESHMLGSPSSYGMTNAESES